MINEINDKQIIVWRYEDAPKELQEMSQHGGDEDWVVEVPPQFKGEWIRWLDRISVVCDELEEQEHPYRKGWKLYIGAHA